MIDYTIGEFNIGGVDGCEFMLLLLRLVLVVVFNFGKKVGSHNVFLEGVVVSFTIFVAE